MLVATVVCAYAVTENFDQFEDSTPEDWELAPPAGASIINFDQSDDDGLDTSDEPLLDSTDEPTPKKLNIKEDADLVSAGLDFDTKSKSHSSHASHASLDPADEPALDSADSSLEALVEDYSHNKAMIHQNPTVFQHCNFGGYKKVLRRSTNWVAKRGSGIKNDDLSSVKVPAGKCLTLYQHAHYRGKSWKICGGSNGKNIRCFVHHKMSGNTSWNDQVSSVKISIDQKVMKQRKRRRAAALKRLNQMNERNAKRAKAAKRAKKERKAKHDRRHRARLKWERAVKRRVARAKSTKKHRARRNAAIGYRETKNAKALKVFAILVADKVADRKGLFREIGVLGHLLKGMARASKNSAAVQYTDLVSKLARRRLKGLQKYMFRRIRHYMRTRRGGLISYNKALNAHVNGRLLGLKGSFKVLNTISTPSKTFFKALVKYNLKTKKHRIVRYTAADFKALATWKGN